MRMKQNKVWKIILPTVTVLWLLFIFLRSLKNADSSSQESGVVLGWFRLLFPTISAYTVRKLAHFTEFFLLGALLCGSTLALERKQLLPALAIGLGAAVTDELLQLFSEGRSCQVTDMLLDFSGVACAVVLFALFLWLLRKKRANARG